MEIEENENQSESDGCWWVSVGRGTAGVCLWGCLKLGKGHRGSLG